jgi:hypothetical protein
MRGKLAPDVRRTYKRKRKLKRLPRGKSFEKGNTVGVATRFQVGNRANPGGRPRSAKLSEAYRALLALPVDEPVEIRTNAEMMAYKVFKMGKKGNLGACMEIGNRAEGRPAVSVSFNEGGDNLAIILAGMRERSNAIGPPEGFIERQKTLEVSNDGEN